MTKLTPNERAAIAAYSRPIKRYQSAPAANRLVWYIHPRPTHLLPLSLGVVGNWN